MNLSHNLSRLLPLMAILLALGACGEKREAPTEDSVAVEAEVSEQAAATDAGKANMDAVAKGYVQLVLELGNHDDSYVDAYYGPQEWKEAAANSQAKPADIAARGKELMQQLPEVKKQDGSIENLRVHYLKTQLRALIAHAESLAGSTQRNFEREAQLLYDTQPPKQNFAEFGPVLQALEQLLPGDEPLPVRVREFKKQFEIPTDKLEAVFEAAIDACRERTKQHIQLPADENFVLEYVTDKPWSGYNWYQGKAQSLIQVNTELPIMIDRAIDLGCHEGYPGHHTYNALLEDELVNKRGWVEYSVYPLFSPQSLIAEGSANYGIELAFPGEEKTKFEKEVLYPLAGMDPANAEKYDHVLALIDELGFAGNEIARQYIDGEIDGDKVVELFQQYTLMSPEKAQQRKRFVDAYGAYVINYNWGKQLVADYVEEGTEDPNERWRRFSKLLSSPRLPSSLNW
ncbi:hypothetical protein SAMN04487965_3064 [Microbulbifer donghaiensis]|uniref:DUF885 domain-containing protein n=1 Tax=Microbulbifer donghaiensis TaxID=494016 RepID=A0A1M5G3D8_9GAMM|nr:hypothetical protein [Microbulbifer donghaiensis]SHF98238.1 hypothetical protein SAMN04487965_3064 [Microbulbifer donghaiensis]